MFVYSSNLPRYATSPFLGQLNSTIMRFHFGYPSGTPSSLRSYFPSQHGSFSLGSEAVVVLTIIFARFFATVSSERNGVEASGPNGSFISSVLQRHQQEGEQRLKSFRHYTKFPSDLERSHGRVFVRENRSN